MSSPLPDLSLLIPALQAQGQQMASDIADACRQLIPVGLTGAARDSLEGDSAETETGVLIDVISDSKIMRLLLDGTAEHIIEARNAKALRWEDSGGVHFARWVIHPGTQPIEFDPDERISAILDDAVDAALAEVWAS